MRESKSKSSSAPDNGPVPKAVVYRLSLYLREIQHLLLAGNDTTSSTQLGALLGFTDAQVRKDLTYFGQFGHPGVGYRCAELVVAIKQIVGTDQPWPVALVGVGNLGRALLGHKGFSQRGFRIVCAFDNDPAKVDQDIDGIHVYPLDSLEQVVRREGIRLGLVAVPSLAAQLVADQLVQARIDGIVNFAPVTIMVPQKVSVVGVDLAIELEQLSFAVVNRLRNP